MSHFAPNIQPFADGLAAHGFRLSMGTYTPRTGVQIPTWCIDRLDDPTFLPKFDVRGKCDEASIVGLIAEVWAKWEGEA